MAMQYVLQKIDAAARVLRCVRHISVELIISISVLRHLNTLATDACIYSSFIASEVITNNL